MTELSFGTQQSGRNNGLVGLTRFQNKEMTGLSFGTQKSGRNNEVVVY